MLVQPSPQEREPKVEAEAPERDDQGPAGGWEAELAAAVDDRELELQVYSLSGNLCTVVPVPLGTTRSQLATESQTREVGAPDDVFDPFDQPERDRIYGLARRFVGNHVRVLGDGRRLRSTNRTHRDGTILLAARQFRRLPFLTTKVSWAISRDGTILDVRDHRVLAAHVSRAPVRARPFLWAPGTGDRYDVPFLLANLCELVPVTLPDRVAAIGEIADIGANDSQLLGTSQLVEERAAAAAGHVGHFIVPAKSGIVTGMHGAVRCWAARDANEAAFSMLAAGCGDVCVPDLKHRWLLRTIAAWTSLVTVLAGTAVTLAAGTLAGSPTIVRSVLGVAVALFALSAYATHRFARIDR